MSKLIGTLTSQIYDKNGVIKKQFQPNNLWYLLKQNLNLDVRIPFISGAYVDIFISRNSISNKGLDRITSLLGGLGGGAITHAALGTGTPATNALGAQVMSRGATTNSQVTTTITKDTLRCVATFSIDANYDLTEEGLFDASTSGNMIAYKSFPAVPVESGDTYILTHEIQASN